MQPQQLPWASRIAIAALCLPWLCGFTFSDADEGEAAESAARDGRIAADLATPCSEKQKRRRLMLVIAERDERNGQIHTEQSAYGSLFTEIDQRLRALGLKTVTQEEIRAQVAAAEVAAYFNNDPDAALAASSRLGAEYVLRGLIESRTTKNAVINVNEVSISMGFVLVRAGRTVGGLTVDDSSFAGADTRKRALSLVRARADEVVAQIYADFCRP
jgi:hypothetical protein